MVELEAFWRELAAFLDVMAGYEAETGVVPNAIEDFIDRERRGLPVESTSPVGFVDKVIYVRKCVNYENLPTHARALFLQAVEYFDILCERYGVPAEVGGFWQLRPPPEDDPCLVALRKLVRNRLPSHCYPTEPTYNDGPPPSGTEAPPPAAGTIDYEAIADALLRERQGGPAKLVRYMADRESAEWSEVAEACCREEVTEMAVKSLRQRTNDALAALQGPFAPTARRLSYRFVDYRVVKVIEPA